MNIVTFRKILGDDTLTDDELEIMLERAKRLAINHYWWKEDDKPTEDEIDTFVTRYEFEIYDLAKAVYESDSREGLKQFTELGVTRVWETGGAKVIQNALDAIPVNTYVW